MRADSWTKLQLKPMVDTAGKKLKQARLRKQLSLEEVARGTKIRVPRLADLEADDYTNFPSMSYVRGFLSIYAKYLGIDVSEFTDTLGSSATSVGIGDYEYLSNGSERVESVVHRKPKRSIWPLVILGFLVGMGVVAALVANFVLNAKRLGNLDELGQKHLSENAAPGSRAQEVPSQPAVPNDRPEPTPVQPPAATPAPIPTPANEPEIRRAQPVTPEEAATSSVAQPEAMPKEVTVKAVKKTWVRITKDSPDSTPLFEDWLYPDTLPLKMRGAKFYIQMSDPQGLQISKNGTPQPIDQPSIIIQ